MASVSTSGVISCRWDWCRSSFPSIDALDIHVKHEHIWPMKPMRKTEIALMRRMDLQSLHSSPNTYSSIIAKGISSPSAWSVPHNSTNSGPMAGVSRRKTPRAAAPPTSTPLTHKRPEDEEEFDTFAQLSSPPQAYSPQRLPASPDLEGLIRQGKRSRLSAPTDIFERIHGHKANLSLRLPLPPRSSPLHRPLSQSSSSSQEVVEQQLTQEDDTGFRPLLPPEPSIESEPSGIELRWPTDDEVDALPIDEMRNSEHKEIHHLGSSLGSARSGENFGCGSLIQTQAPYSSQAMGWNQTQ